MGKVNISIEGFRAELLNLKSEGIAIHSIFNRFVTINSNFFSKIGIFGKHFGYLEKIENILKDYFSRYRKWNKEVLKLLTLVNYSSDFKEQFLKIDEEFALEKLKVNWFDRFDNFDDYKYYNWKFDENSSFPNIEIFLEKINAKVDTVQEMLQTLSSSDKTEIMMGNFKNVESEITINKIFISHSSKDRAIVEEIIEILELVGVTNSKIFCSSFEGYGIELGEDFLIRLKNELNNNVLVLFVLTDNFYKSPICLCEMGATWVKTSLHIPIIVPPFTYSDIQGVIPSTQGFTLNDPMKLNSFKKKIEDVFSIENKMIFSVWERKRDKIIESINRKISENNSTTEDNQKKKSLS